MSTKTDHHNLAEYVAHLNCMYKTSFSRLDYSWRGHCLERFEGTVTFICLSCLYSLHLCFNWRLHDRQIEACVSCFTFVQLWPCWCAPSTYRDNDKDWFVPCATYKETKTKPLVHYQTTNCNIFHIMKEFSCNYWSHLYEVIFNTCYTGSVLKIQCVYFWPYTIYCWSFPFWIKWHNGIFVVESKDTKALTNAVLMYLFFSIYILCYFKIQLFYFLFLRGKLRHYIY